MKELLQHLALRLRQRIHQFQDLRFIVSNNSPSIVPIDSLPISARILEEQESGTYHRSLECSLVLSELLQSINIVPGALDDASGLCDSNEFEYVPQLIGSRHIFGNVKLEVSSLGRTWRGVRAGLVLRSMGSGISGGFLEESVHSHRSWGAGFVEEGDDIEGLAHAGFVLGFINDLILRASDVTAQRFAYPLEHDGYGCCF